MTRLVATPLVFVAALLLGPGELRHETPATTFLDVLVEDHTERSAPARAPEVAAGAVHDAIAAAVDYLALPRDEAVLDEAARAGMHHDHATARRLAERVIEVPQPLATRVRAHDIAGYAAATTGEWDDALAHLRAAWLVAPDDDELAPFRALWLARAALHGGDPALAESAAGAAAGGLDGHVRYHESRTLAARARLRLPQRRADAIGEVERLLDGYPEYPHVDLVTIELAEAELALERWQDAATRLDTWLWERPFHPFAARAETLVERAVAAGAQRPERSAAARLERGSHLRWLRQWDAAEVVLQALHADLEARGNARTTLAATRFELARNAYDSARFHDALRWLDLLEAEGTGDVRRFDRARWRSRTLSRLERPDEAWDVFAAYYEDASGTRRARALREWADDLGRWEDAISMRNVLFSAGDWRSFDGAFARYLAGDLDRATDLFTALAARSSGSNRARYLYWLGRTREQAGDVDGALTAWAEAVIERPGHYYGIQATNRVLEYERGGADGPVRRPGRIHWDGIDGEPSASLSAIERHHDDDVFEPWAGAVDVDGGVAFLVDGWGELFPSARAALALVRVGAAEDARLTLRDAAIEYRTLTALFARGREVSTRRPIRLTQEMWSHEIDNRSRERGWWGVALDGVRYPVPDDDDALDAFVARHAAIRDAGEPLRQAWRAALREVGDHYVVRRLTIDDGVYQGSDMAGPARNAWLDAYPRIYGRLVEPHARAYDLNPFMFWSLVIVESDMNPDSISHADAYGLLQVIPRTGELVALRVGAGDFGIHDLLHPSEAIRYGSWYLDQLIDKFHGQELLAFVAYNAGPHQVARWLDWRGERLDLDEFIETVPFDGARRYPQRIVQYLSTYRSLYYGDGSVYIGNELDPTYLDNIYF